ncbi:hypothetical protein [Brevundimonas sp.]|uniref:hypothetical protein n=1 Tax=Brevundimonas sp. TaxID=1871086 RepID=UPI0011F7F760|nr:hypothetical protein [Brevundimonas sp.]TAJ65292.1 MAG: hypothetical protein EPO49_03610 [Brevundimonas sp.]
MRTAVLIAAAAALALSACNRTDDAATDASTEAMDASSAATDTAATTGGGSGGTGGTGGAAGSAAPASGETMDPATGGAVSDGAMTPSAQPGDTAGNNVTETQRRLDPPAPQ